jgi:glucosamine--fructose-6-phosphate aminotransferase (isomerizing)
MCGIFGFITEKNDTTVNNGVCFERGIYALRQLQNRGYDSAGACCIYSDKSDNSESLLLRKYASLPTIDSIDRLEQDMADFDNSTVGIFHTRWATHGAKTDQNAHPHLDHTGKIALVHNGIIENYHELKSELENENGIVFKSETDTEVIANLISVYYSQIKSMEEAIMKAIHRLRGTWALVIINSDKPDNMYCARRGSALLIGFGAKSIMIASEQAGFGQNVSNYISLNDEDITVIRRRDNKIVFSNLKNYELKYLTIQANELSPEPYDHWTLKEIHEQYESSIRAISFGGRIVSDDSVRLGGLIEFESDLKAVEHLILLGCGTSLNAAKHSVQYFRDLNKFTTVQALDGSEFTEQDIPLNKACKTAAIFLSQSGETKDLARCLKICRNSQILVTIGVINTVDSLIAREVDCGCYLNAGREVGVASTKAFTSQVILLSMISIHFAQINDYSQKKRKEYVKSLRQLSQNIKYVISSTDDDAKSIAKSLIDKKSMFVLGKGHMIPVAEEVALKTKEIGYIHSEAYGGNALRHGPYALIEPNTPILFISPTDSTVFQSNNGESHNALLNNTIEEVKSRQAMTIVVTDADRSKLLDKNSKYNKIDHLLTVPHNPHYQGLLLNIPLQLVAYHLSVLKGNNPDKPRHLSKCVSV